MMRVLLICLLAFPFCASAQQHLTVQGTAGNFYLLHTTAPKENYYSIGRMYNVSPKEIAPYNKLTIEKGLNIGQEIKIPLKNNFSASQKAAADEAAIPVYHKIEPKETLTLLSARYNKVPLASLKAWNGLKSDALPAGEELIVGFINVKKDLSPLAGHTVTFPAPTSVKEKEVTETVPEKVTPPVTVPVIKQEPAPVKPAEPKKNVSVETPVAPMIATDFKGGVFKNQFTNSGAEEKGTAGVFKSISGWEDGKYYCLHNTALPNTIVKITNNANGKVIYAKVLETIPDLKANNSLIIRVSSAAADILGAGLNNFDCTVGY